MSHVDIEPPRHHTHGHRPSTLLDRAFSIAAMLVAVSSLGIGVYEARARREHDKISVWPRLSVYSSDAGGVYTFNVGNVGLGPAVVRGFELRVDGKAAANLSEVRQRLAVDLRDTPSLYSFFGEGSVILPAAHVPVIQVGPGPSVLAFHAALGGRANARVCYCSLYDECWMVDDSEPSQEPRPVEGCAAGAPGFGR